MHRSEALRQLRGFFRENPNAVKAGEARALGFSHRQTLDHLIRGKRRPTLDQATAISERYGIATQDWSRAPVGGKI